jgi:uncharacterized protein YndB with AHSA1/START domain
MSDKFIYVTFIQTTAEKLWDALLKPEFTRLYWRGVVQESEWKKGSSWQLKFPDGRTADAGEVLEIDPPKRLVVSWRNEFKPELKEEGYSRCTFTLEPLPGGAMKLTVTHEIDRDRSKFIEAVSNGWPGILSSLKTLLETGKALPEWPK